MLPDENACPPAPGAGSDDAASAPAAKPENLSPEEQMARYEEALKESDWGHQPC